MIERAELRAIPTVYSYYPPEIRAIVDEVTTPFPHEVFLRSVLPASSNVESRMLCGGLDDFHVPIIDKLIAFYRWDVPALSEFPFRYPTMGSEEGIREFMTLIAMRGIKDIYVFEGEYEGYREVAKTRGIETREVKLGTSPRGLKPGYWFLSNPSAQDGQIIPNYFITNICDAGHKVFYDLAYLGMTPLHHFDLSHPNIVTTVVSFSKPYGLFYHRVGFTFGREEIPALYANKWFKGILGLLIAERIVERLDRDQFFEKYKSLQARIISRLNKEYRLGLTQSDAFLLAFRPAGLLDLELSPSQLETLKKFKRGGFYRFCLTPYFLEQEQSTTQ